MQKLALNHAANTINRLAREGDVDGLYAYIASAKFTAVWISVPPSQRIKLCAIVAKAGELCLARTSRPPAPPQRRATARWDAKALARLAAAFAKVGDVPDAHERVSRLLGDVSPGAARRAKTRYLDAATAREQKAA